MAITFLGFKLCASTICSNFVRFKPPTWPKSNIAIIDESRHKAQENYKLQCWLFILTLDGDKWKLSYGRPRLLPRPPPRTAGPGAPGQGARALQAGEAEQRARRELGGGDHWQPDPGDCDHQEWDPVQELHRGDREDRRQRPGSGSATWSTSTSCSLLLSFFWASKSGQLTQFLSEAKMISIPSNSIFQILRSFFSKLDGMGHDIPRALKARLVLVSASEYLQNSGPRFGLGILSVHEWGELRLARNMFMEIKILLRYCCWIFPQKFTHPAPLTTTTRLWRPSSTLMMRTMCSAPSPRPPWPGWWSGTGSGMAASADCTAGPGAAWSGAAASTSSTRRSASSSSRCLRQRPRAEACPQSSFVSTPL